MSQIYLYLCSVKNYILLLFFFPLLVKSQCDLELLEFDPIAGEITVAFNNTENCGGEGGPDGISELQFGFQALDEDCNALNQGWEFPWGLTTSDESNHPGWIFSATTNEWGTNWTNLDVWADYDVDPPYYTGDTITFPLADFYQNGGTDLFSNLLNAFDFWLGQDLGIQVVIWQISYGPTMYAADGGWAEVGVNGDGTSWGSGLYEDANFTDNWIIMCPDDIPETVYVYDTVYVELPPDTVYIVELDTTYIQLPADTVYITEVDTVVVTDTIPVAINWYFYDTTYIYVTDTLVEYVQLPADTVVLYETVIDSVEVYLTDTVEVVDYVYLTDTIEVEVAVIEYVVLTDTILDTLYIDCATGLDCAELFPDIYNCENAQLYIPNAFSPNNDGTNDAWSVKYDPDCWTSVGYTIFNRWGDVMYWGAGDQAWDGSVNGGSHYVSDGVYVYTCSARRESDAEIVQESGYITVFR